MQLLMMIQMRRMIFNGKFCANEYKKEVPIVLNDNVTVTSDCGSFVKVFYEDTQQYEIKQCYFTRKGRYFNYHGKRLYV